MCTLLGAMFIYPARSRSIHTLSNPILLHGHHYRITTSKKTLNYLLHMDSVREDQPRISVGSVQDWRRLKANYNHAALAHLEEIVSGRPRSEKDALIAHMNRVHSPTTYSRAF